MPEKVVYTNKHGIISLLKMDNILLKNIIYKNKATDILIKDGLIGKIAPAGEISNSLTEKKGLEIMDCAGKHAFPGFINMHTHAAMSLMRGMQEDVVFKEWIDNIWKMEANVDSDFVYWGTKVAALEMIKTGTTTFNDQYWYSPSARKAALELGIRPVVSYVILDQKNRNESERQKEQCIRYHEQACKNNDRAIFEIAFHAIYSVSEEMILWASDFARKNDLALHIHLSETEGEVAACKLEHGGLTPVEYLDRLGILDSRTIAAHTLWLTDNDIQILGKHKVNCVHNINSNTKLTSGYKFRYNELRDAGANVCLGTDGCASSNNLDMLEAMKTSALIQKAWRNDPKAMPLEELAEIATSNGAKALRINSGCIKEGADADILIVDTENTFFLSPGSFMANFVYSAHSDCIDSVLAGGRFVMKNRKVESENEILENARLMLNKINK